MSAKRALAALGDPTRRAIFERLKRSGASVGDLAERFPVSRPAVSQHLKVLKDAGLVKAHRDGVRRVYRIDLRGLVELRRYVDGLWGDALSAFEREAAKRSGKGS